MTARDLGEPVRGLEDLTLSILKNVIERAKMVSRRTMERVAIVSRRMGEIISTKSGMNGWNSILKMRI